MRRARLDKWPVQFTILSRDEKKQAECRALYPEARYVLGDVTDFQRLRWLMIGHIAVIHAAALKYIPEGEFNADECVRVNIDGARSMIAAARESGIKHMVGISTDKAAQPVNIYGMTKAVMERLFSESGYKTCRYGNVIGSTGSVVPVMQHQFRTFGHVKITDQYMTRFWMSIDDAVDTIVRTFSAPNGATLVPSPKGASMHAIAYAVLGSLGERMYPGDRDLTDDHDPRIQVIGKRPGEKQHEDLISHYELFRTVKGDDGYYMILPPGNENYDNDHPALSSKDARTISREELAEMIKDAALV